MTVTSIYSHITTAIYQEQFQIEMKSGISAGNILNDLNSANEQLYVDTRMHPQSLYMLYDVT